MFIFWLKGYLALFLERVADPSALSTGISEAAGAAKMRESADINQSSIIQQLAQFSQNVSCSSIVVSSRKKFISYHFSNRRLFLPRLAAITALTKVIAAGVAFAFTRTVVLALPGL